MIQKLIQRGKARDQLWVGHDPLEKARFLAGQVRSFLPTDARHLDIACGNGQILISFSELGCYAFGIDLSLRRLGGRMRKDLPVACADMTQPLPFSDASFKVVSLISTVEHIEHPDALIEQVQRVLTPDGVVVVQIPNPHFPIDLHYFLPFYGYLPSTLQFWYRRAFVKQGYYINYYTNQITKAQVRQVFANFKCLLTKDFVYPRSIAPNWLRPFYGFFVWSGLSRLFPTGHLLVFQK